MITIRVYRNGYEIIGHAIDYICAQITLWHWLCANIIAGLDKESKVYMSSTDNHENPCEGYSWAIYKPEIANLKWVIDDMIQSLYEWSQKEYPREVIFEQFDNVLIK